MTTEVMIIETTIILTVYILFAVITRHYSDKREAELWNNGICKETGQEWGHWDSGCCSYDGTDRHYKSGKHIIWLSQMPNTLSDQRHDDEIVKPKLVNKERGNV